MQVFRLMDKPDRVIAFNELPERLVNGNKFEMIKADLFPRHWKDWMGKKTLTIRMPPERDPITGQVRTFQPIVEEDHYFYLVDWGIKPVVERWNEVCSFVKQHVSKDVRLTDKIDDMAKPLAQNQTDGVTLEPEEVVVIPIPPEFQERTPSLVAPNGSEIKKEPIQVEENQCPECLEKFTGAYAKNKLRFHLMKHKKEKVAA